MDRKLLLLVMQSETVYDFQWNPAKALYNVRKHGVTFDQAATVFLDALALTVYDEANSQDEDRWFTLGYDASGRLLAVTHTYDATRPKRWFRNFAQGDKWNFCLTTGTLVPANQERS